MGSETKEKNFFRKILVHTAEMRQQANERRAVLCGVVGARGHVDMNINYGASQFKPSQVKLRMVYCYGIDFFFFSISFVCVMRSFQIQLRRITCME